MAISFFGFCVGIRVFPVAGFIVKSYSMGRNHPPERWLASLAWAKQSVSRFERFLSAFVRRCNNGVLQRYRSKRVQRETGLGDIFASFGVGRV